MDVLARGNQAFDWLERWDPFISRFREPAGVRPEPGYASCGGYLGDLSDYAGGLPHFNYAGQEIPFREALRNAADPYHYHVGNDYVDTCHGWMRVSTVFSGIEWAPSWGGPPKLFETMVEHDTGWIAQYRHTSLDDAVEAHRDICDGLSQSWWLNLGGRA